MVLPFRREEEQAATPVTAEGSHTPLLHVYAIKTRTSSSRLIVRRLHLTVAGNRTCPTAPNLSAARRCQNDTRNRRSQHEEPGLNLRLRGPRTRSFMKLIHLIGRVLRQPIGIGMSHHIWRDEQVIVPFVKLGVAVGKRDRAGIAMIDRRPVVSA